MVWVELAQRALRLPGRVNMEGGKGKGQRGGDKEGGATRGGSLKGEGRAVRAEMMMISIRPFGLVGCEQPLRGARRIHINHTHP
jgi:hypothetical protein